MASPLKEVSLKYSSAERGSLFPAFKSLNIIWRFASKFSMVVDSPQDSHWDWNTKLVHSQLTQSCRLSGAKMVSNGNGIEIQLMVKNWTGLNQTLPALSAA